MQEFEAKHRRLSDRVERVLMQLVILGLVAVVLVQTLAVVPSLRQKLNLLEGTDGYAVAAATPAAKAYKLTVHLDTMRSAPEAKLLVAGKAVASFAEGQATASVEPGQLVAVDGSRYEQALTFRVVAAPGLDSPPLGGEVTTRGDRQSLGVVRRRSH